jgi:arylsulfatase
MEADRTEMHDLAAQQPDRVAEMKALYDDWTRRCGVIPRETILAYMKAQAGTAFWEEK